MSERVPITIFTPCDAQYRFRELLAEASVRPVGIAQDEILTAYVVSKGDFESMLSAIAELEDQLWLAKAEVARRGGFAGGDCLDAHLSEFSSCGNAKNLE